MSTTLASATALHLHSFPDSMDILRAELVARCKVQHGREAIPGRVAGRAICVCGYTSIGNGGTLCSKLRELDELDTENLTAVGRWLEKARALDRELDLAAVAPAPNAPRFKQPAE